MAVAISSDPQRPVDVAAGAKAGAVGGLAFLLTEALLVPLALGGTMWQVLRSIAGLLLGRDAVAQPATADVFVLAVALVAHFALSVVYGVLLAIMLGRTTRAKALVVGGLFGLALYLVNFHGFTLLFPWFATMRNWVTILSHFVFGLVTAAVYTRPARPRTLAVAA